MSQKEKKKITKDENLFKLPHVIPLHIILLKGNF